MRARESKLPFPFRSALPYIYILSHTGFIFDVFTALAV